MSPKESAEDKKLAQERAKQIKPKKKKENKE